MKHLLRELGTALIMLFALTFTTSSLNAQCQGRLICTYEYLNYFITDQCTGGWAATVHYTCVDYNGTTCIDENLGTYCVDPCSDHQICNIDKFPQRGQPPEEGPLFKSLGISLRMGNFQSHPGVYQRAYQAWDRSQPIKVNRFWWQHKNVIHLRWDQ